MIITLLIIILVVALRTVWLLEKIVWMIDNVRSDIRYTKEDIDDCNMPKQ